MILLGRDADNYSYYRWVMKKLKKRKSWVWKMSGWKKIVDGEIIQREKNNEPHSHHLQKEGREELRHHLWEKNEIYSSNDALRRITTQQRKSQNLMCFNTLESSHEKPIRMSDMTFCFFCNNNINNRINNNINDINNNVYKGKPSTTLKTSTTASTNVKNHPSSSCNELKKHLEQQQEH